MSFSLIRRSFFLPVSGNYRLPGQKHFNFFFTIFPVLAAVPSGGASDAFRTVLFCFYYICGCASDQNQQNNNCNYICHKSLPFSDIILYHTFCVQAVLCRKFSV